MAIVKLRACIDHNNGHRFKSKNKSKLDFYFSSELTPIEFSIKTLNERKLENARYKKTRAKYFIDNSIAQAKTTTIDTNSTGKEKLIICHIDVDRRKHSLPKV